jgi:hypothetical protein
MQKEKPLLLPAHSYNITIITILKSLLYNRADFFTKECLQKNKLLTNLFLAFVNSFAYFCIILVFETVIYN